MNRLPNASDLDDDDMDTDERSQSQPSQPPAPVPPTLSNRGQIDTIDMESDDDEDEYQFFASESIIGPPLPPPMPAVATSVNNIWSTIIPPAFLRGVASATRIRGGNVSKTLRVFSVALLPHPRPELENGGKMILPPSFLSALTQRTTQLNGPMLFRVSNNTAKKVTHCGVLEFIAEEGRCYMPYWRMHNIGANEGDIVTVENTTASIGRFALFEPQSVDFLDISNPTALLENALRNFACITKGEIIVIHYNDRIYELKVLDTKPTDVLNIIECDMDVDFAPAVGSKEESNNEDLEPEGAGPSGQTFTAFVGSGSRLNGKPVVQTPSTLIRQLPRGQPDFEWKPGNLRFIRKQRRAPPAAGNQGPSTTVKKESSPPTPFTAFKGRGVTLSRGSDHDA